MTKLIFGLISAMAVAGLFTAISAMMQPRPVPVRAKAQRRNSPHNSQRLRQDPRTGIYYPEA